MQILAIESSSLTAGAAIIKDDVVLAEYSVSFKKDTLADIASYDR